MGLKEKQLYEKVMNKGGINGDTIVPEPNGGQAAHHGNNNPEKMNKIDDPSNTSVEETDPATNTKPTGDASASNKASISTKASAASAALPSTKLEDFTIEVAFEGEELTEEFKEKATTIFEAAVNARVEALTAQLEEDYAKKLEEGLTTFTSELSEQIDSYLNYVVEEWMKENELAIESSLRSEITEEFIDGMRNLFAENYIEIPEEKLNVLDNLVSKVDELETKLDETINENIELYAAVKAYAKESMIAQVAEGLTVTQKDKFLTLAEGVEFTDEESFGKKIEVLKESFFKQGKVGTTITEEEVASAVEPEQLNEAAPTNSAVSKYVTAISRTVKK
jgi:hypothetical protein